MDNESKREKLKKLGIAALGGSTPDITSKAISTQNAAIGSTQDPIDVRLSSNGIDDIIQLLEQADDVYVETLYIETKQGTVRVEARDDGLVDIQVQGND